MTKSIHRLSLAAVVAALYFVLTAYVFQPFSFLPLQFRVAEALMLLPVLSAAAVPGLFVGCLLANLFNPGNLGPIDIVLGSLATLLAALWTRRLAAQAEADLRRPRWFAPRLWLLILPSVVCNGLIVGSYLPFLLELGHSPAAIASSVATVALGEAAVLAILGLPLLIALRQARFMKRLL